MGYWAVWQTTQYPLAHVAWNDMTHAAISFVAPRAPVATSSASPYATLDSSNAVDNLGATGMADFAAAAHAGGTHPIISLGGAGAGAGFAAAASPANQNQFVSEVLAACAKWHYDGVDLDWEDSINLTDFQSLALALRAAAPAGFLITAPVGAVNNNAGIDAGTAALWKAVQASVDQINVMTYTGLEGTTRAGRSGISTRSLGAGSDHPFDVASSLAAWAALGDPEVEARRRHRLLRARGQRPGDGCAAELRQRHRLRRRHRALVRQHPALLRGPRRRLVSHWDATAMTGWLSWTNEFHPAWTRSSSPATRGRRPSS